MNLTEILSEGALADLRAEINARRTKLLDELNKIDYFLAEHSLGAPRCGRPAKNGHVAINLTSAGSIEAVAVPRKERAGRTFTAAQRAEQAARMRKYWAKRRKLAK